MHFREVWRSNVQERAWRSKDVLWNVLVCLSVFRQVLRVRFGWNWCERSLKCLWVYLVYKCLGKAPQRPKKGPWGGPNLWAKVVPSWQLIAFMFTDHFRASWVDHDPWRWSWTLLTHLGASNVKEYTSPRTRDRHKGHEPPSWTVKVALVTGRVVQIWFPN